MKYISKSFFFTDFFRLFYGLYKTICLQSPVVAVFLRTDDRSVKFDSIIDGLVLSIERNDNLNKIKFIKKLAGFYQSESLGMYDCQRLLDLFEIKRNNDPSQLEVFIGRKLSYEENKIFHDCVFKSFMNRTL